MTATQAELAAELGSVREVVTRKLGKLSDAGILERQRGTIRVMKPEALRQIRMNGE
ncbi:helix-turn-helix domain-containing protein [uncultured Roseibium sp.]|uniref:helix-turn-helix domain-containing protein n=1 Tax=uncultured Roseibium sp. TaxID=1936171 RepID=UPI00321674E6